MHLNSQLLFERYALPYFDTGQRVLEIGPDAKPSTYQRLAEYADTDWVTVDLDYGPTGEDGRRYSADGSTVDHYASNRYVLPFPSDQFDVVVSGQVLEHVPKIWTWFVELGRVCKPGGFVVCVCPVSWPYHEAPVDCWRVFPEGMKALCEEAGMGVVLSKAESLEPRRSRRTYPGPSHRWSEAPSTLSKLKDSIRQVVGWPTATSIDTVTIARKPTEAEGRSEIV